MRLILVGLRCFNTKARALGWGQSVVCFWGWMLSWTASWKTCLSNLSPALRTRGPCSARQWTMRHWGLSSLKTCKASRREYSPRLSSGSWRSLSAQLCELCLMPESSVQVSSGAMRKSQCSQQSEWCLFLLQWCLATPPGSKGHFGICRHCLPVKFDSRSRRSS